MVLRFQTQHPVLWYLGLLEGNKNNFTLLPSCPYSSFSPKQAPTLRKVPFWSTSPESRADLLWDGCCVTTFPRLWYQDEDNLKKTEFKISPWWGGIAVSGWHSDMNKKLWGRIFKCRQEVMRATWRGMRVLALQAHLQWHTSFSNHTS